MHRAHIALTALLAFFAACATHTATSAGPSPTSSAGDQSSLTADEITAANLPTAYDLVERLRRSWLRADRVTGGAVVVYMDQQDIGGAEKLRDISSTEVASLQYFPNDKAIQRWGSGIQGSVIEVTRRR